MTYNSILMVGCGNMAGAMLEGWLKGGVSPGTFTVMDPKRDSLPGDIPVLRDLPEEGTFDAILLGVKPQMLADVAPQLQKLTGPNTTILSILAGVQLDTLAANFPEAKANVRVMPNLAVSLGKAPVALAEAGLDEGGRNDLYEFMAHLGTPSWVGEDQFDLVTALAGSGPGFVYRFIDALKVAATELGLEEDQARELAIAMTEGASALASQSEHDPGKLADMVASPGGVTRKGLDVLDKDDAMVRLMTDCLRAARDRSMEMAREARG
ncbi:pyrroline-5-carboxylate reductase family protein [Aurantiacibacter poecillastricola]|uniref:pyrroline-5-carboxylate reductase family protein n=1 Tax=Aurantiacibacter poecillastricola TaxID=3064385 RepID=UPI00273EFDC7|nr:pyrroline-5-carboxylate reductase [Aurantiacibacter sp. 219JJ12-13]MDP5262894.1 pyrroline-5-carboxylate reductase [Aurantiacibacter sp. 219JJ12-13]